MRGTASVRWRWAALPTGSASKQPFTRRQSAWQPVCRSSLSFSAQKQKRRGSSRNKMSVIRGVLLKLSVLLYEFFHERDEGFHIRHGDRIVGGHAYPADIAVAFQPYHRVLFGFDDKR